MIKAAAHPKEAQRLDLLRSYRILDTEPEISFNSLVEIASQIADMPIALVSFVDEHRQWFKAKHGLQASETSRDVSFCAHAILQSEVFEVSDARADKRFSNNALVLGPPFIRFYAGVPLQNAKGLPLGTLCVIDTVERKLTTKQVKLLKLLAGQVMDQVERHSLNLLLSASIANLQAHKNDLELSNVRMVSLLDKLHLGVLIENFQGHISFVSQRSCEMFNLSESPQSLKGQSVGVLMSLLSQKSLSPAETNRSLNDFQKNFQGYQEGYFQLENLKVFRWECLLVGNKEEDRLWIFSDVTHQKKLELFHETQRFNMAETSRLNALGKMAGTVAHEINNPLAIIEAKAWLIRNCVQESRLDAEFIQKQSSEILKVISRIATIVKGLKNLSRQSREGSFEKVVVHDLIEQTASFCVDRMKELAIHFSISVSSKEIDVECNSVQISQVLLNLLDNACDAVELEMERWVRVEATHSKDHLQVRVLNGGAPIPADVQAKMFDLYYTTKPVGKGTGLGLKVSSEIIEKHGGKLYFDHQSQSTCFVMELPLRQK